MEAIFGGEMVSEATEERYRRKPVYQWPWPLWLATVLILGFLLAIFLAAIGLAGGAEQGILHIMGYTLALSMFPVACVLFWWWYRALHEEELETRSVPIPNQKGEGDSYREPILFSPYAPPRLAPPQRLEPDLLVVLIKELWEHGRLSRRAVMKLQLPGGGEVSRGMWERLIGGYENALGQRKPGLLAQAGLIEPTLTGSWRWRSGVTLEDAMGCFNLSESEPDLVEGPGWVGWAGDGVGESDLPALEEGNEELKRWLKYRHELETRRLKEVRNGP